MDAVEDIKQRIGIEDVIGDYLELKRAGRNLRALSPFSNEKTPSFMVSPEKQIWHDFSSGKGGNMFSFIMEMEGVDFKGALEILARKASVDLSQYRSKGSAERTKQKNRIYQLVEAAVKFYQLQFSKNQTALKYILQERGYNKDTALKFQIGYSPNTGDALFKFLKSKKFSDNEIKQAGLATERYGRITDMFRGRIMIPLSDAQGRPVGFTARLLDKNDTGPKYINTPQTLLYDKGRQVFGLHLAKEKIRSEGFVVIVEGNLDVIASHQAGIENVVASAGTALSETHLKELAKFTDDVRMAFDQDSAGLSATERTIPLSSKANINLSIITIPSGKDPDELIKSDPGAWKAAINSYDYALDWLIEQQILKNDPNKAIGKKNITNSVLPVINQLQDSVEQDHYLSKLADIIGVDKQALTKKYKKVEQNTKKLERKKKVDIEQVSADQADDSKSQNQLLAICMKKPELRKHLTRMKVEMFTDESARIFYARLIDNDKSFNRLAETDDYGKILEVLYEELYANLDQVELQYEVNRLVVHIVEKYVKHQKLQLKELLENSSDEEQNKLIKQDNELNQLLRKARG